MANISADRTGAGQAHLRIHIRAIHINLPTLGMHERADFLDLRFKNAMGAGIGHHQGGELGAVLIELRLQVINIHIAIAVTADNHHLHARHHGRGRVGAMRGRWDQANGAVRIAARKMPGANGKKPRIFTLAAGIGLQRHSSETGDARQPGFQPADHGDVARRLIHRREGVDIAKAREGHRNHLGRCVQLHGAGPKRDHAAIERDILVFQRFHIAQHAMFGMMAIEDRSGQEGRSTTQRFRQISGECQRIKRRRRLARRFRQHGHQPGQIVSGYGFIHGNRNTAIIQTPQIEAVLQRRRHHGIRPRAGFQRDGIEKTLMAQRKAKPRSRITGQPRQQAHTLCNAGQPFRPMPHRIHAGHHGQQHLRGADIGSRFFAADVLFAGLQREPHRGRTGGIHGNAHKASRHQALMRIRHRHESGMWPTITHGHAKTLRTAHHHIRAHFARRLQQSQRKRISRDNRQATHRMHGGDLSGKVTHFACGAGILQHQRKGFFSRTSSGDAGHRRHHHMVAKRCGAGFQNSAGLRMKVRRQHNHIALGPRRAMGQRHGFCHRRRLIQ